MVFSYFYFVREAGDMTESRRRWFELPRLDDDPNKTFMERWREHMKRKQETGEPARFAQVSSHMSLAMRKPAFCICENKDADQLRGNQEADQRLCFRYTDSTIPLLPKHEILSLLPGSHLL